MELSGDGLALDTPLNSRLVRIQPSQKKYIYMYTYVQKYACLIFNQISTQNSPEISWCSIGI